MKKEELDQLIEKEKLSLIKQLEEKLELYNLRRQAYEAFEKSLNEPPEETDLSIFEDFEFDEE